MTFFRMFALIFATWSLGGACPEAPNQAAAKRCCSAAVIPGNAPSLSVNIDSSSSTHHVPFLVLPPSSPLAAFASPRPATSSFPVRSTQLKFGYSTQYSGLSPPVAFS